jgi:hypothetical protein
MEKVRSSTDGTRRVRYNLLLIIYGKPSAGNQFHHGREIGVSAGMRRVPAFFIRGFEDAVAALQACQKLNPLSPLQAIASVLQRTEKTLSERDDPGG